MAQSLPQTGELLSIFKALADPTRLRVLKMLMVKPLCVCEVMSVLGMAQSTTSRHLRILLQAGLVEEVYGGVWTIYKLPEVEKSGHVSQILDILRASIPTDEMQRDSWTAKGVDRNRICRRELERKLK